VGKEEQVDSFNLRLALFIQILAWIGRTRELQKSKLRFGQIPEASDFSLDNTETRNQVELFP